MKKSNFFLVVMAIILISALILRIREMIQTEAEDLANQTKVEESELIEIDIDYRGVEKEAIKIIEPLENELISSPYEVRGMMPANWLLESDFYVVLIDNQSHAIIDVSKIEIEKDLHSNEMLPYFSILEFSDLSGQGTINISQMKDGNLVSLDEVEKVIINYISE